MNTKSTLFVSIYIAIANFLHDRHLFILRGYTFLVYYSISTCHKTLDLIVTVNCPQSCRHEGWSSIAKYLTEDVPLLLKSEDIKDVQNVISVVFKSPPADLREFIKWVAEVRRQEDGNLSLDKEEKGRLAIKVCYNRFFIHVFMHAFWFSASVPVFFFFFFFFQKSKREC